MTYRRLLEVNGGLDVESILSHRNHTMASSTGDDDLSAGFIVLTVLLSCLGALLLLLLILLIVYFVLRKSGGTDKYRNKREYVEDNRGGARSDNKVVNDKVQVEFPDTSISPARSS